MTNEDIEFTAYDRDSLANTVGVYEFSDKRKDWHRIRTLPGSDS